MNSVGGNSAAKDYKVLVWLGNCLLDALTDRVVGINCGHAQHVRRVSDMSCNLLQWRTAIVDGELDSLRSAYGNCRTGRATW